MRGRIKLLTRRPGDTVLLCRPCEKGSDDRLAERRAPITYEARHLWRCAERRAPITYEARPFVALCGKTRPDHL
jgi:hypothetical protein